MNEFYKVNKATKKIVRRKSMDNPTLDYGKDAVWLQVDRDVTPPSYNFETHKLVETTTVGDLSDIDVDAPPKVTVRMVAEEMTDAEKKDYAQSRLVSDDAKPTCCELEQLYDVLISKGVIAASDCGDELKARMTERKRLRGLAE